MTYGSLRECCNDLEKSKQLIRISKPADPDLVIPELHRRVYQLKGPALLFENVIGSPFQAVSNVFGTDHRCEFIFRDVLAKFDWLFKAKIDPFSTLKSPLKSLKNLPFLLSALPARKNSNSLKHSCTISDLPQIRSWPLDGGAFITLPQVISFPPKSLEPKQANVGMYRIQISGNDYKKNEEIGLHYQLHRGIGIHHLQHQRENSRFNLSIGIGGPPAYTLASIFPLPEGLSEILFSGLLNNRRYTYSIQNGHFIPQDVDFCICGTVYDKKLKEEGPFGDHLGYYSLKHPFPYLGNLNVFHKNNPLFHFTVVGRPPQEDSGFGKLIHDLVSDITENEFPGIKSVHAVDCAGVHPLLLAIGTERYMPFRDRRPEEIITQAFHLLGKGQTSLAKYLLILAENDDLDFDLHNIQKFLHYLLERLDFNKDLHFVNHCTIDTLDYSGDGWNSGSKLIMSCNRNKLRSLSTPDEFQNRISNHYKNPKFIQAGIVVLEMDKFESYDIAAVEMASLCKYLENINTNGIALIVVADDAEFCTADYTNFIWVSFTRSNPAYDIYGLNSNTRNKHWTCDPPLIIDARKKPHHAPELIVDAETEKKVDVLISSDNNLKSLFS